MMIELEPSFWNGTGRQNDKSARGHETAPCSDVGTNFGLGQFWGVQLDDEANLCHFKLSQHILTDGFLPVLICSCELWT